MNRTAFERIREAFIRDVLTGFPALASLADAIGVVPENIPETADGASPAIVRDAMMESAAHYRQQLDDRIRDAMRTPTLGAFIRAKAHRLDRLTYRPAYFEQGQISRDYWSRLLNDEIKPSKEKLLRVAILLRLTAEEAEALLDLAGYSLSEAILRDVVVQYCLERGHYDFTVIEQLLADRRIQSLFNDRRG